MPGPFRVRHFARGEGVTTALASVLREIWNEFREDKFESFDSCYPQLKSAAHYRDCLRDLVYILQQYCTDESFDFILRNLRESGTQTEEERCVIILNALLRMKELTAKSLRDTGSVEVPEYLVTYFGLQKLPVEYERNLPCKPKARVNVTGKTANYTFLKNAYKRRARHRANLCVSIGKHTPILTRIEDIPEETLQILDKEMRRRKRKLSTREIYK